jgi:hypothetical protein
MNTRLLMTLRVTVAAPQSIGENWMVSTRRDANLGWRPSRIASRAESGVKRTIAVQLVCGVQEPRRTFSSSGTEPSHNSRLFLIVACSSISVLDPETL